MMIGYSLSFCVSDIIRGLVDIKDVKKIVTPILSETDDEWDLTVAKYAEGYWRENPYRAREIVAQLRAEGRIEQPRLTDPEYGRTLVPNSADVGKNANHEYS